MGISHWELEHRERSLTERVLLRLGATAAPMLRRLIGLLPKPLRRAYESSVGSRLGRVFALIEKERFGDAFQLAMESLRHCETTTMWGFRLDWSWWIFMESATRCASHLGEAERQQVLARVMDAPKPGGFQEAQCQVWFARWRWDAGDRDGALAFAGRAVLADPSWASAHIMLAFYELITGTCDPLPRLQEAVRLAQDSLETIRATPAFAERPDLIAALVARGA